MVDIQHLRNGPMFRETILGESYNSKRFSKAENLFRATKGSEFLNSLKVFMNTRSEMISSDMMKLNIVSGLKYQVKFLEFFSTSKHLFSKF